MSKEKNTTHGRYMRHYGDSALGRLANSLHTRAQSDDRLLISRFPKLVGELSLESILHLQTDDASPRTKPPRNLDNYRLISMKSSVWNRIETTWTIGYDVDLPKDVTSSYGTKDGKPHIDSGIGIGLVYRGMLTAVCAGELQYPEQDRLKIRQIQAVWTDAEAKNNKYRTGLYAGFKWRETLVQGMIEIAEQFDCTQTVSILAAANNIYPRYNPDLHANFVASYDDVAVRMGFQQNQKDGNWYANTDGLTRHTLCPPRVRLFFTDNVSG